MTFKFSKLTLVVYILITLMVSACGSANQEESSGASVTIEAQTVAEATPTTVPTLTPSPTQPPVSADLPTEIIEPISPVSPVAKTMNETVASFPGSEPPLNAAIADLSEQTGIAQDQITVVSIEAKDWPDSSLGCPEEGFMYAQVITPGYLIVLEAGGQQYNYHTDETGKNVVLCEK